MGHNHSHTHHHHHGESSSNLKTAFFLNFIFAIIEIVGGIYTNSIAILSDALHDLGDSLAIAVSWFLEKKSRKKSNETFSFGYKRFSLLGALINSTILVTGSIFIITEAIPRIINPEETSAKGMIALAVVGILVNGAAVLRVRKGKTLNEKVISWHLIEDILGWVAVLIVSIVLLFTDWYILDPILSLGISFYIIFNVFRNLKETVMLFLQAVPSDLNIAEIEEKIKALGNIKSMHHTHLWSMDGSETVFSTHIVIDETKYSDAVLELKEKIKQLLREYEINHVTIEVELDTEGCYMRDETK